MGSRVVNEVKFGYNVADNRDRNSLPAALPYIVCLSQKHVFITRFETKRAVQQLCERVYHPPIFHIIKKALSTYRMVSDTYLSKSPCTLNLAEKVKRGIRNTLQGGSSPRSCGTWQPLYPSERTFAISAGFLGPVFDLDLGVYIPC
mgnify:CR=1 FL=1